MMAPMINIPKTMPLANFNLFKFKAPKKVPTLGMMHSVNTFGIRLGFNSKITLKAP